MLRCLGQRDGLISSVWRSYTEADSTPAAIFKPNGMTDRVRFLGYNVVAGATFS